VAVTDVDARLLGQVQAALEAASPIIRRRRPGSYNVVGLAQAVVEVLEELQMEAVDAELARREAETDCEAAQADRNLSRGELDDIAALVGLGPDASGTHEAILERVAEFARRPASLDEIVAAYGRAEEAMATLYEAQGQALARLAELGREIARVNPETDEFDRAKIERDAPARRDPGAIA
jgi:hypothetical protein